MKIASRNADDHVVYVKCLVEAGAEVNVQTKRRYTALMYKSRTGHMVD